MKVALEVAELDALKYAIEVLGEDEATERNDVVLELAKEISKGNLVFNEEENTLTQKLKFPLKSDVETSSLTFGTRLNVGKVQKLLSGTKITDDMHGTLIAYGAALTGKPKAVIAALDVADFRVVSKVAVFFI